MNQEQLTKLTLDTLEEHKGLDIVQIDVHELTDITDAMIICTATSTRHAKTLADKVVEASKKEGVKPYGLEGEQEGEWILIDLVDVVVHIMLAQTREFYSLEKLWGITEEARKKHIE